MLSWLGISRRCPRTPFHGDGKRLTSNISQAQSASFQQLCSFAFNFWICTFFLHENSYVTSKITNWTMNKSKNDVIRRRNRMTWKCYRHVAEHLNERRSSRQNIGMATQHQPDTIVKTSPGERHLDVSSSSSSYIIILVTTAHAARLQPTHTTRHCCRLTTKIKQVGKWKCFSGWGSRVTWFWRVSETVTCTTLRTLLRTISSNAMSILATP